MPRTVISYSQDSRAVEASPPGTRYKDSLYPIRSEFHDEAFFLRNTFLGQRELLHFRTNNDQSAILFHQAYFCPVCGEIWLRRVITSHESYTRGPVEWAVRTIRCQAHGDGLIIQPSEDLMFPVEVLKHDVLCL